VTVTTSVKPFLVRQSRIQIDGSSEKLRQCAALNSGAVITAQSMSEFPRVSEGC